MRVLIAEDDPTSRCLLETSLLKWGYEVEVVNDGRSAVEALLSPHAPRLAILDWMMPEQDGIEVCRILRSQPHPNPIYIILLTARDRREDIVVGLEAGADDYITKPFERQELKARLQVGERIVNLQSNLADRVDALEKALEQVKQLQGMLPICSYCKKIRDDQNYWQQVENYITEHSEVQFSHSICPECFDSIVKPEIDQFDPDPESHQK
ncbi:MAG: response regulator [Acidobacteriota bacterium]